jgi:hypothetical protein
MGIENHKVIRNFITKEEVIKILDWVNLLVSNKGKPNHHLSEITKDLNGKSTIIDISNNSLTNYITNFQSVSQVLKIEVPDFINRIIDRISHTINIPKDNIFLQVVDMNSGGKITPHYDASIDGYINYKCNISVLSEDYQIFIGEDTLNISETDLYCFEASLYKHWTNEFKSRRVFLSFGFILPYENLGRDENDPRVRLSQRIYKYFQKV